MAGFSTSGRQTTLVATPRRFGSRASRWRGGDPRALIGRDAELAAIRAISAVASATVASCSSVLDNCREPVSTFASGLAGGSASSAADPVLFSGNGGANAASLWNVVDNNGSKHRD